jgi:hypothetical protein
VNYKNFKEGVFQRLRNRKSDLNLLVEWDDGSEFSKLMDDAHGKALMRLGHMPKAQEERDYIFREFKRNMKKAVHSSKDLCRYVQWHELRLLLDQAYRTGC